LKAAYQALVNSNIILQVVCCLGVEGEKLVLALQLWLGFSYSPNSIWFPK